MEKAIKRYFPIFLLPTLAAFTIGFIVPFLMSIWLSFCKFTTVTDATFNGVENYVRAFQDTIFRHAFWYTALFAVVSLVVINIIAFLIALALTQKMRGTNIFRTVFFMPNLIGGIVLGYIWQLIFNGILAAYSTALNLNEWYGFAGLVILVSWQQIGYMMIIYIAGLQSIPGDVIEAAQIDGASGPKRLFKVTIPMMMPSITICTFLSLVNGFKLFDQDVRAAGSEHLQPLLRPYRLGGRGPGQGRDLLYSGGWHRSASAPGHPLQGGTAMKQKQAHLSRLGTGLFSFLCIVYVLPIVVVLMNSFKKKSYISLEPFQLPNETTLTGLDNYTAAIDQYGFLDAVGWTVFITVGSVLVILICTSMCAWYITRVKTRVTKAIYILCVFSMVVPFQMVMFTLSLVTDRLGLGTPWGLIIIYLGFGAGLAVFMFCGFVKSIPIEIEEAAMIDGCSPIRTFFSVVLPIMKPTYISVGILETMWIWNDFLLPYLTLDLKKYKTISIVIQYMKGSYGRVDMGAIMAALIMAVIPVIVFYLSCQKYIIKGVAAGAVKG